MGDDVNHQQNDPAPSVAADRTAAIRDLVQLAQRHQNDLDETLALHTDDAAIVNIAGRRVMGKEAIRDAMGTALHTPLADVVTNVDIDDIRFVKPDVAIVACTKYVSDQRPEADRGDLPSVGRLTYVVALDQDVWRISLAQTTPLRSV